MDERENWLRAVEFRYPEWIPCSVAISPANWKAYRGDLESIVRDHPRLFPLSREVAADFYDEMPPVYRGGQCYTDNWGCVWQSIQDGLEGQVVGHPLADWHALDTYRMPDPRIYAEREPRDWQEISEDLARARRLGLPVGGSGERLFDRLYFLRGFENLMMDFATEPPELTRLIEMLEEYEHEVVQMWLERGVDYVGFHTDLATQRGLMISPASFRKHVKPMFTRLFQRCRRSGAHVFLSSDGRTVDIVDDLVDSGVSVHDPQLRANGLEDIMKAYRGKLCAKVDLDRQGLPFATPAQVRDEIKQVVDAMAAPEGGLMLGAAVYGVDVSLQNIAAICEAMEDYCFP